MLDATDVVAAPGSDPGCGFGSRSAPDPGAGASRTVGTEARPIGAGVVTGARSRVVTDIAPGAVRGGALWRTACARDLGRA